jgi:hypothetical protein
MKQTTFETRGVMPPVYLSDFVKSELLAIGELALSRRTSVARGALVRLAAGIPVLRGTIALVEKDYAEHGPRRAA